MFLNCDTLTYPFKNQGMHKNSALFLVNRVHTLTLKSCSTVQICVHRWRQTCGRPQVDVHR